MIAAWNSAKPPRLHKYELRTKVVYKTSLPQGLMFLSEITMVCQQRSKETAFDKLHLASTYSATFAK